MSRTEDSHRAKQAEAAGRQDVPLADDAALPDLLPTVSVRNVSPDQGIDRSVILSAANPWRLLLPQDPTRRDAVVWAVDNDVYICSSVEMAAEVAGSTDGVDGAYLPAGLAVPITNRAAHWVACTLTATSTRVSVLISKDDA